MKRKNITDGEKVCVCFDMLVNINKGLFVLHIYGLPKSQVDLCICVCMHVHKDTSNQCVWKDKEATIS